MKVLKNGVSLVAVLIALTVASFGGEFWLSPSQPEVTSVVSNDSGSPDGLAGTLGLHW